MTRYDENMLLHSLMEQASVVDTLWKRFKQALHELFFVSKQRPDAEDVKKWLDDRRIDP